MSASEYIFLLVSLSVQSLITHWATLKIIIMLYLIKTADSHKHVYK